MKLAIDIFGCTMETLMLAYFYHKMLGKVRIKRYLLILIYLGIGIATLIVSTFISQIGLRTSFAMIYVLVPLFAYKRNWVIKILFAILILAITIMSEALAKAISLSIYGNYLELQLNFLQNYIQGVIFSKLIAFLLIIMLTSVLKSNENKVPIHLFLILFFIPIMSMITVYELKEMNYGLNSLKSHLTLTLVVILLIMSNIVLFYFFNSIMELNFYRTKVAVSETMLKEQKIYYEKLTKQQEEIRSLSHDMNNKLLILSGYINDGNDEAANNYIQDLQKEIAENKPVITGYSILDMVLASKKELASKQETAFDITFFIITELTIDIADVAIVIANCLDNALEATAKIAEIGNRYILLDMKTKGNYLLIKVSNTVVEKVEISHNKIKTSKMDFLHHGFGLRNIEKIADKHDGSLRLECNENLFVASVMLRLDDSQLEQ